MQKRVNSKKVTNQTLVNNQRNSQIANRVRGLDASTFRYAENLRTKQWPAF